MPQQTKDELCYELSRPTNTIEDMRKQLRGKKRNRKRTAAFNRQKSSNNLRTKQCY